MRVKLIMLTVLSIIAIGSYDFMVASNLNMIKTVEADEKIELNHKDKKIQLVGEGDWFGYKDILDQMHHLLDLKIGESTTFIRWQQPVRYYVSGLEEQHLEDFESHINMVADLIGLDVKRHDRLRVSRDGEITLNSINQPESEYETNAIFLFGSTTEFEDLFEKSAMTYIVNIFGFDPDDVIQDLRRRQEVASDSVLFTSRLLAEKTIAGFMQFREYDAKDGDVINNRLLLQATMNLFLDSFGEVDHVYPSLMNTYEINKDLNAFSAYDLALLRNWYDGNMYFMQNPDARFIEAWSHGHFIYHGRMRDDIHITLFFKIWNELTSQQYGQYEK